MDTAVAKHVRLSLSAAAARAMDRSLVILLMWKSGLATQAESGFPTIIKIQEQGLILSSRFPSHATAPAAQRQGPVWSQLLDAT